MGQKGKVIMEYPTATARTVFQPVPADVERIGKLVLNAAYKVHTTLGPGLLEDAAVLALPGEAEGTRYLFRVRSAPEPGELGAFVEKIGFVRRQIVHEDGEFLVAPPVVAEEMVVLLKALELVLLKPASEAAFQEELGPVVEVYPAVAVYEVPKKSEDVARKRNNRLFEHLSPQCIPRRLTHDAVRVFVGDPQ